MLLVEDSPDNQLLIKRVLAKKKIEVDTAENGQEGLEKALNGLYDLVLMDIQLPLLNGYEATEKLRSQKYSKPIIALTAHAMADEKDRCFKLGFTDYISKPIDFVTLLDKIAYYGRMERT